MSTWDRAVEYMFSKDKHNAEEATKACQKYLLELEEKYREVLEENCQLKRVIDELGRGPDRMDFPETFDEYVQMYKIVDTDEVYTNGIELIPVFRVRQWLEHEEEKIALMRKLEFNKQHGINPLNDSCLPQNGTQYSTDEGWTIVNRDGLVVQKIDEEIIFEDEEGF